MVTFVPVVAFPTMVTLVTIFPMFLCRYDYVKAREVFRSVDTF